jgi:hypothetical protein
MNTFYVLGEELREFCQTLEQAAFSCNSEANKGECSIQ